MVWTDRLDLSGNPVAVSDQIATHYERANLAAWLDRLDHEAWDAEMERDFSSDGPGMKILKEVDEEIAKGSFKPLV